MKTVVESIQSDPNMRQVCRFEKVSSRATFSRRLKDFSKIDIMDKILDTLVKRHTGTCRSSLYMPGRYSDRGPRTALRKS
jgi:hypothetical protein